MLRRFLGRDVSALQAFILGLAFHVSSAHAQTPPPAQESPAKSQNSPAERRLLAAIEKALEQDDFFKAEELLKELTNAAVLAEPRVLVLRALVEKGFYRLAEAETLLKAALRKDRSHGDALFEMALILMERKQWRDAEVLLYIAKESQTLSGRRQAAIPYYLGVVSFESGRVFDSRNSFLQLTWRSALDPALEQSTSAYLSRIARERPWSVVVPLSWQYDSNMFGLTEGTALPEGISQRSGSKLIAGLFANWSGLGGIKKGDGPWGCGVRLLTTYAIPSQFKALNVVFAESELNWSKFLGERLGPLKLAALSNWVNVSGKAATASVAIKSTLLETELSMGYEADLQKTSASNRSSLVVRGAREFSLWSQNEWSLMLPVDLGTRLPVQSTPPREYRSDVTLVPTLSWTFGRRLVVKGSEKLGLERVSDAQSATSYIFRTAPGLTVSYTLRPWLVLSLNTAYEWERRINDGSKAARVTASMSVLGLL